MDNVIEIRNLSKDFGHFTAIDRINLSVKKGTIFGLLGQNGAGKTTTIKTMTGRLSFRDGDISILGLNVKKQIKEIHQSIGVVSEAQNLYDHLTVWENIDFFRELYNVKSSRTLEIINTLSLTDKLDVKVSKLSKGLKQRVLLARSILHQPKLLFLDEPTSGIDPASSFEVHRFIKTMKDLGTTIFLTSHDMDEVDSLCDEVAFINRGKIVATGSPKALKKEYAKSEIEVFYLDEKSLEVSKSFLMNDKETFLEIAKIQTQYEILSIHSKEATMKDVFLKVIERQKDLLR